MAEEFHGCWGWGWLAVSQHCAHRSTIRWSCCDESCQVLTVDCGAASDDDVSTFRDGLTLRSQSAPYNPYEVCSRTNRMAGCFSCDHKRRSFPLRDRRGWCCWSQDQARRAGRRRFWNLVRGFSDSFASGKKAAKQLERPRGIDETAVSRSLFETRGGHHQSIGFQRLRIGRLVVRWYSASDSAAPNRSRSST